MGKILVLYDSHSGNTEKMANHVAEGAAKIPHTEVRLRKVADAKAVDVIWCDGIAVGSPTNMGLLSWLRELSLLGRGNDGSLDEGGRQDRDRFFVIGRLGRRQRDRLPVHYDGAYQLRLLGVRFDGLRKQVDNCTLRQLVTAREPRNGRRPGRLLASLANVLPSGSPLTSMATRINIRS